MISSEDFKQALSHLAGVVTIITTRDIAGEPRGFTATSLCSLSLEPPLVLCCLARSADCYEAFTRGYYLSDRRKKRYFAVNILSHEQRTLAQRFAIKGVAKYRETQFAAGKTGAPLLPGSLAVLECSVYDIYPGGDHSIIVGLVELVSSDDRAASAGPLLYYEHAYGTFAPLIQESAARSVSQEGAQER